MPEPKFRKAFTLGVAAAAPPIEGIVKVGATDGLKLGNVDIGALVDAENTAGGFTGTIAVAAAIGAGVGAATTGVATGAASTGATGVNAGDAASTGAGLGASVTGAATGVGVPAPPKKTAVGFVVGVIGTALGLVPYPAGKIIPAPGFANPVPTLGTAGAGAGTLTSGAAVTTGELYAGATAAALGCAATADAAVDTLGTVDAGGVLITAGGAAGMAGNTEVETSGATVADHCVQVQVQPVL
ncbi:MAG: hypothetical protein KGM43_00315 [Planctomycetota bacterium]|nr:hypothetical protein [Planctomycetota bacterium]